MDEYIGRVVANLHGKSKYRVLMRDSDGLYILRSVRGKGKLATARRIDLMTKWRVIA